MNPAGNVNTGVSLSPQPLPTHVAVALISPEPVPAETTVRNILQLITLIVALKIPMLTLHFPSSKTEGEVTAIVTLFTALLHEPMLDQQQIKISALGKWYELPERALELIKHVISATSEYDRHFVNICMRYDGQEDIADGAKLLAKNVQLGKLAPEQITKETLKETLLVSMLLPPNLIIYPKPACMTHGVLLWDSMNAVIHFSEDMWRDFDTQAFLRSIAFFQHHG